MARLDGNEPGLGRSDPACALHGALLVAAALTLRRIALTTLVTGFVFIGIVLSVRPLLGLIYFWIIMRLEPPISDALWLGLLAEFLLLGPLFLWLGIAWLIGRRWPVR